MRVYVPLFSALLLWQGVTLRHSSAEPAPLTHISALHLQRVVPPLQSLAVHAPPPPPLSVSIQGLDIPPLLPSAALAYAPMLW